MTQDGALDMIIDEFVSREIEAIRRAAKVENANIDTMKKMYFNASEFATIQLPEENRKNIINRAVKWIKERWGREKKTENTEQIVKTNENDLER